MLDMTAQLAIRNNLLLVSVLVDINFVIKPDNLSHAETVLLNSVCHFCFVAIKTGRYTYEKKTKIIKEVKQLELARLAALPTQPLSDNVVALSKLPQQITDNKYELVIEQILTAYQEHPLFGTNFNADMKQSEETYLASVCVMMTFF